MGTEVMRHPAIALPFRRSVRRKGKTTRTLIFEPGQIVELQDEDFRAVRNDLGHALVLVDRDEKGRPKPQIERRADPSEAIRRQAFEEGRQAGRQEAFEELTAIDDNGREDSAAAETPTRPGG